MRSRTFKQIRWLIIVVIIFAILTFSSVAINANDERTARRLVKFEADWLTANLNEDQVWLTRFFSGKLNVRATDSAINERSALTASLIHPALASDKYKVRISGTVTMLTNDQTMNRSYTFLNTFNKLNGKWQIIASNFTPSENTSIDGIERDIKELELQLARALKIGDSKVLEDLLAADSTFTFPARSIKGSHRMQIREVKAVSTRELSELSIRVYSSDIAVATGIRSQAIIGGQVVKGDRFTDTWLKRGGEWEIIAAHNSLVW